MKVAWRGGCGDCGGLVMDGRDSSATLGMTWGCKERVGMTVGKGRNGIGQDLRSWA